MRIETYPAAHRVQTDMGKLTTHVLNLATGIPAAGLRINLHDVGTSPPRLLAETQTNGQGRCAQPLLEGNALYAGRYALTFHVADYFRATGVPVTEPPFLDQVVINFGIADPGQDYHIPLLITPWSYSTYRGS